MAMDRKYVPVSCHIKSLSNREFARLRIGQDELIDPSVIWSSESHPDRYVFSGRTNLSEYVDALVYIDFCCTDVCGYLGAITARGNLKTKKAL
jgi:hypothetical protein